jgi:hypothetical protein
MTREEVAEVDPEILLLDGLDEALVGVVLRHAQPPFALYDVGRIRDVLMERDGLSEEEADEHIGYNITDAWLGPRTPGFLVTDSNVP